MNPVTTTTQSSFSANRPKNNKPHQLKALMRAAKPIVGVGQLKNIGTRPGT